jgi:hypothetical protein
MPQANAARQTDEAPFFVNRPIERIHVGSVTASIFRNEGQHGAFHSVKFEKSYKQGEERKYTDSFNASDLLELSKAADKAYDRVVELSRPKNPEQR